MTSRSRRPSAYQPRPATLPPGTHFRGPRVASPAVPGPVGEGHALTDDEPGEPPAEDVGGTPEEIAVVVGPDDRPSPRSRLPVLVLMAIVLVAATAYVGWRFVGDDGQAAAPTPPTSTRSPTPSASLSATALPSVEPPPVEPPDGGSYLEVTVLDSGDLDVDQWVRSSTPLTALSLSVPADTIVSDGVVASNLRASADGKEADVPTSLGSSPAVITLADVHGVHLSYRLSGAVLHSPSRADRALARTVSLDLDLNGEPRREPSTISFRGATALTVICDGSAGGNHVRCGRREDNGDWWVRAASRGANDRVMALLELPAANAG